MASTTDSPPRLSLTRQQLIAADGDDAGLDTPRMGMTSPRFIQRVERNYASHTMKRIRRADVGSSIHAFHLSEDGSLICVGTENAVKVFRTEAFGRKGLAREDDLERSSVAQAPFSLGTPTLVRLSANAKTAAAAAVLTAAPSAAPTGPVTKFGVVVLHVDRRTSFTVSRTHEVASIALNESGTRLALTGRCKTATVFDVSSGQAKALLEVDLTLVVFAFGTSVFFSPHDRDLCVGGDMRKCTVWDVEKLPPPSANTTGTEAGVKCDTSSERLIKTLYRQGIIHDAKYNDDGTILAIASGDFKVGLYRPRDNYELLCELITPAQHNHTVALSFDAPEYALGGENDYMSRMPHCGHPDLYGLLMAVQSGTEVESARMTMVHCSSMVPVTEMLGATQPCFTTSQTFAVLQKDGVTVLDLSSRSDELVEETSIGAVHPVTAMSLSQDGTVLALYRQGKDLSLINTFTGAAYDAGHVVAAARDLTEVMFSPVGSVFACTLAKDASAGGGAAGAAKSAPKRAVEVVFADAAKVLSDRPMAEDKRAVVLSRTTLEGDTAKRTLNTHAHVLHWALDGSAIAVFVQTAASGPRVYVVHQGATKADVSVVARADPGALPSAIVQRMSLKRVLGDTPYARYFGQKAFYVGIPASQALGGEGGKGKAKGLAKGLFRLASGAVRDGSAKDMDAPAGKGDARGARSSDLLTPTETLGPLLAFLGATKVQTYAPSHDCRSIAVGGNGHLYLFDTNTREATLHIETVGWVMGVEWSPDDRHLAVGGHDKRVFIVDVFAGIISMQCGGERTYWPVHLTFSTDGRVLADANRECAVYSCDGSRLPLRKHVDAAPVVHFPRPLWATGADPSAEVDPSVAKHTTLLTNLVLRNPMLALNPLPSEEDIEGAPDLKALYFDDGDLGDMQPLRDGGARLVEVMAFQQTREEVRSLLAAVPALALLPSSEDFRAPAFEIAVRKRDIRILRALLSAACKAPVMLRYLVATELIPRIVDEKLSAAVSLFLNGPNAFLEKSGAAIRAGCKPNGSPLEDWTYQLHDTWGGEGTTIWQEFDPAYQELDKDGNQHVGVEVQPLRVPLPGFSSRKALKALLHVPGRGTFDSPMVHPVIDSLWDREFKNMHRRSTAIIFAHLGVAYAYSSWLAAGMRSPWVHPTQPVSSANFEPVLFTILGFAMLGFSLNVIFKEATQLWDASASWTEMVVEYARDPWNFHDLFNFVCTSFAVAVEMLDIGFGAPGESAGTCGDGDACRNPVAQVVLAWSLFFLLGRVMQTLRGYEYTGWLVEVLTANLFDFLPFLLIITIMITTFAVIFLLLFTPATDVREQEAAGTLPSSAMDTWQDALALEDSAHGFGHFLQSWLSSYAIGLFADFELDNFSRENTVNEGITRFFLVVYLLLLGVVGLNALIALLGDSYSRVQENQEETKLRLRATLIIEYYSLLSTAKREEKENDTQWLHVLEVINDVTVPEWAGQLAAYKEVVRGLEAKSREAIKEMGAQLTQRIDLVAEHVDDLMQLIKKGSRIA